MFNITFLTDLLVFLQDFDSVESASAFLENVRYRDFETLGSHVRFEFALTSGKPDRDRARDRDPDPDWVCPSCSYVNFARRRACLQCQGTRPEEGRAPHVRQGRPPLSRILLLAGLDLSVTEEKLRGLCLPFGEGT